MDWDDVRFFLALARDGSVRGAGAALGVSHSTVARRVEGLEKRLGARLFDRSRDGYALTDAGQRLVSTAEHVEAEMASLERSVLGADERLEGPVHLTLWDDRLLPLLLPALSAMVTAHPGMELHLSAEARSRNLTLREADVALRVLERGASPPEHLMGRRLVPMSMGAYRAVDAVVEDRWLAFSDRPRMEQMVAATRARARPLWGSFDSLGVMVEAVAAGLGVGILPCYAGEMDPRLERTDDLDVQEVADVWLLCHPDLRTTTRLKRLREVVVDAVVALRPLFVGAS